MYIKWPCMSLCIIHICIHTHSALFLADDDKDLLLPLVFILKTRITSWSLWQNALHTALEDQKAKKFTSSDNCSEKLKLWVWSNSSGTAEYLNWINCFGRTLKCCGFDVLKHKCKEQETVHCKVCEYESNWIRSTRVCLPPPANPWLPIFPVFIPLTLTDNSQFWLMYAENQTPQEIIDSLPLSLHCKLM